VNTAKRGTASFGENENNLPLLALWKKTYSNT
jgi:hypothetical protein